MQKLISILVDDRERNSSVLDALRQSGIFDIQVARMKTGDYRVDNRFLFERKTLPDLAASIASGRLFKQMLRLAGVWDAQPVLVLEGSAGDLENSGMRREAIQGALITVSLFIGVPVLRSRSPFETVRIFQYAARQGRAVAYDCLPRHGSRPKGKPALQNHVLQGLPGVGPARARRLLEHFGSVRAVMMADESELVAVDGVGGEIARRIAWAVEEGTGTYKVFNTV